jgi:hypothetical protein
MTVVQVGHARNVNCLLASIKVGDFLISELEGWWKLVQLPNNPDGAVHTEDQRVGRED